MSEKSVWKDTPNILVLIQEPLGLTGFFKYPSGFFLDLAAVKYSGWFANHPNSEEIMKRFPEIPIVFNLKTSWND